MENKQKLSFINYEANAWFDRNLEFINNYNPKDDVVIDLFKKYNFENSSVLEIGCSAGYRLNAIKDLFNNSKVYGIDPSSKAIEYGKDKYLNVDFTLGTADNLENFQDSQFDVVVVGFVFYVIDRNILLKVISEIDRVLKNNGTIIIIDFFSESSAKNIYHHINDYQAYSFKQNYEDIFTASKLYNLIDKSTLSHTTKEYDASNNYKDNYCVTLLKKDLHSNYK